MERLILHIGTPKTGTTSLQRFFALNRDRFRACGIDYPLFGRFGGPNGLFLAFHGLFLVSEDIPAEDREYSRRIAQAFPHYVASHTSALLSCEGLYGPSTQHEGFWSNLNVYLSACGVKHVEVVVYLRRQDQFIYSTWKQRVKRKSETRRFEDYLDDPKTRARMNYDLALTRIESCFGSNAIIVRRYDRNAFVGGDIFHDFCTAIGIPWNDAFVLPEQQENPSLPCAVAEVKRCANMAHCCHRILDRFLLAPALVASLAHPELPGTTPLAQEETQALLAKYAEGNRRVAERYLGGEALFPEPWKFGPKWKRDDAAMLDAAITMFAEALAVQQQKINRLERLLLLPFLYKIKRWLSRLWG